MANDFNYYHFQTEYLLFNKMLFTYEGRVKINECEDK